MAERRLLGRFSASRAYLEASFAGRTHDHHHRPPFPVGGDLLETKREGGSRWETPAQPPPRSDSCCRLLVAFLFEHLNRLLADLPMSLVCSSNGVLPAYFLHSMAIRYLKEQNSVRGAGHFFFFYVSFFSSAVRQNQTLGIPHAKRSICSEEEISLKDSCQHHSSL